MILGYSPALTTIKNLKNSNLAFMEDNDCAVRAIASATNCEYDIAHNFVAKKFNRKFGKGTYNFSRVMTSIAFSNKRVNRKKLKIVIPFEVEVGGHKLTVGSFIKQYKKGTYILLVRNHVFTVKDSVVLGGNPDDAIKTKRILKGAWEIE